MSKWVEFAYSGTSASGKTKVWSVLAKEGGAYLGSVDWYGPWRQYVFTPDEGTIWNPECLRDVSEFVDEQTLLHRAALKQVKVVVRSDEDARVTPS